MTFGQYRTSVLAAGSPGLGGDVTNARYDGAIDRNLLVDPQGNQTRAGKDTFTYNLDHTLASATVGGVKTTYTYDVQGLQLSAVSNVPAGPRSRSWATDVNGPRPLLTIETTATPGSTSSRGFLPGPSGDPLALLTSGQVDAYLPDWLGGVAYVVSPQGQPVAAYDFDPYGNPRTDGTAGNTPSTVDSPIRLAGMYQDTTLGGQYSTQERVYSTGTGRFTAVDPVPPRLRRPAVSPYAYVAGRATAERDPTGADPCLTGGNGCDNNGVPEPGCNSSNMYSASCEAYRAAVQGTNAPKPAPPKPPTAVLDPQTGLCVANCGVINDAIDEYFRINHCVGWTASNFLGVVGLSPCGQSRDEVERSLLQEAAKQRLEQDRGHAPVLPFMPGGNDAPDNEEIAERIARHTGEDGAAHGFGKLSTDEIAVQIEQLLNRFAENPEAEDLAMKIVRQGAPDQAWVVYDMESGLMVVVNPTAAGLGTAMFKTDVEFMNWTG